MQSIAFDGCRGWYHPAHARRGVILCNPLGLEALCVRQSYRILADRLAAAGLPVLRFDFAGTGDSAGSLEAPRCVATWLANIEAAARWLETAAGVTELAFVGTRLGATLAAAAAAARGGIERLVLLAPFASGHAAGREMKLTSQVLVTMGSVNGIRHNDGPGVDVAGFVTPDAVIQDLRSVDLLKLVAKPAAKALVLTVAGRAAEQKLASHLAGLGATVETRDFPEYHRLINEPTSSRPCLRAIDLACDWLSRDLPAGDSRGEPRLGAASDVVRDGGWRETGLRFGPRDGLVGVLAEPAEPARAKTCAILLNGGRDCHIGWARGTVELARTLADAGIASLRFDLTWIGDSQPTTEGRRIRLYDPAGPSGLADVTAAIDEACRLGFEKIALFGACSGAYMSFVAGLGDPRVTFIVARNLQRFVWRLDDRLLFPLEERVTTAWRRGGPQTAGWRGRLERVGLEGEWLAYRVGRRLLMPPQRVVSRLLMTPDRVQRRIAAFNARGGRMLLVYSSSDEGRSHLDEMLGTDGAAITGSGANEVVLVDGADHNFTSSRDRRGFAERMCRFLGAGRAGFEAPPAQPPDERRIAS